MFAASRSLSEQLTEPFSTVMPWLVASEKRFRQRATQRMSALERFGEKLVEVPDLAFVSTIAYIPRFPRS